MTNNVARIERDLVKATIDRGRISVRLNNFVKLSGIGMNYDGRVKNFEDIAFLMIFSFRYGGQYNFGNLCFFYAVSTVILPELTLRSV